MGLLKQNMNKINTEAKGQGLKNFHLSFSSLETRNSPSHMATSFIALQFHLCICLMINGQSLLNCSIQQLRSKAEKQEMYQVTMKTSGIWSK